MNPSVQNGSPSTLANGQDKQGDGLLVLAACSGDAHAFVELSKPHSKRILLMLYRITNNWHDAEDAFQEALMKAFLHLDSFQGKASFSTWLTSIAVNTALMLLRKRRDVLRIGIDNTGDAGTYSEWDFKDSRDNPEQCFERQQQADLIQSAILQLSPKLRKAVVLQYSRAAFQSRRSHYLWAFPRQLPSRGFYAQEQCYVDSYKARPANRLPAPSTSGQNSQRFKKQR